jgi:hypothetical protein
LRDWCRPDTWKLYEVSLSNYGADNQEALRVTRQVFIDTVSRATSAAEASEWRVVVYTNDLRDRQYAFIEPNGDAMTIISGREIVVGNFFREDFELVCEKVRAAVDVSRVALNVATTYPGLNT